MPHPQFRLRSLFVLTAVVAVGFWLSIDRTISCWQPQKYVGLGLDGEDLVTAVALICFGLWLVTNRWPPNRHG